MYAWKICLPSESCRERETMRTGVICNGLIILCIGAIIIYYALIIVFVYYVMD